MAASPTPHFRNAHAARTATASRIAIPAGPDDERGTSPGLRPPGRHVCGVECMPWRVWAVCFGGAAPLAPCRSIAVFASASPTRVTSRRSLIASILSPRRRASTTLGGSECGFAMRSGYPDPASHAVEEIRHDIGILAAGARRHPERMVGVVEDLERRARAEALHARLQQGELREGIPRALQEEHRHFHIEEVRDPRWVRTLRSGLHVRKFVA